MFHEGNCPQYWRVIGDFVSEIVDKVLLQASCDLYF